MEDDLEEALNTSIEQTSRPMAKTQVDHTVSAIESSIGTLTGRAHAIEQEIAELQDQHRHAMRSLAAFKLALRMLQS